MSPEQIAAACQKYDRILEEKGFQSVKNQFGDFKEARLGHVRWMCAEVGGFVEYGVANSDQEKIEKAHRWLGFIQGVMHCYDVMTISDMKDDNR